jgi:integrase/recombinase XerD
MKVVDAVPELLAELAHEGLRPSTVRRYRDALAAFTERLDRLGIEDVRAVRREHIEAYQAGLLAKKLAPRTVTARVYPVLRLLRRLHERGHLFADPTKGVPRLPERNKKPRQHVSEADINKLLAAPDVRKRHGVRERAILEVLYSTAMRLGELLALEVADIDLEQGLVRIREGKGRKERAAPLGAEAARWVKAYLAGPRAHWLRSKAKQPRLWVSNRGTALTDKNIHVMLTQLSRRASFSRSVYPHAIRRSAATHMMARGAGILTVKALLGHARLRTTQLYTLVAAADVKQTHARTHPLEALPPAPALTLAPAPAATSAPAEEP